MNGMKIGVVTYVVLLQFGNHVAPSALLEDARLFPDQFECGADAAFGEHLGQALCCVVVRRQQVILRIEPEDDVDVGLAGGGDGLSGNQSEEQQEDEYPSRRGFHGRDVYRETAEQTRVQPGRQRSAPGRCRCKPSRLAVRSKGTVTATRPLAIPFFLCGA